MLYEQPGFRLAGDSALLVELGDGIDWAVTRRVHALDEELRRSGLTGVLETVPSFRCLLILYDPLTLPYARLRAAAAAALADLPASLPDLPGRVVTLPVAYGGEHAPDLESISRHTGLAPEEVVARQSGAEYRVFTLGFCPGNAYFGGLPPELATPRLERPRVQVPVGSLGIGGEQISVYPLAGPGGFRLIGRTPVCLYEGRRPQPGLLQVGDRVRFRPINQAEYDAIAAAEAAGTYVPEITQPEAPQPGQARAPAASHRRRVDT